MFLLPLTRPEGAVISIFFLAYSYKQDKYFKDKNFLIFLISVGVIFFLLRYSHYGKLLPNTFYHKSVDGFNIFNFINIYTFKRSIMAYFVHTQKSQFSNLRNLHLHTTGRYAKMVANENRKTVIRKMLCGDAVVNRNNLEII